MRTLTRLAVGLVLLVLRFYRLAFSPVLSALGAQCRFFPTCSEYAIESVRRRGVLRGGAAAARRLLRCHPRHPGGVDLP